MGSALADAFEFVVTLDGAGTDVIDEGLKYDDTVWNIV